MNETGERSEHDVYAQVSRPSDTSLSIWRYMDFSKFTWLLSEGQLYFPRADKLGDPFEGSFPPHQSRNRAEFYQRREDLDEKTATRIADAISDTFGEVFQKGTFINSWHINPLESAAMWKLYLDSDRGIAVRSTYGSLKEVVLHRDMTALGEVCYIDYSEEYIPEGNSFWPFYFKRKSFEHEVELRAVHQLVPEEAEWTDASDEEAVTMHVAGASQVGDPPDGVSFPIDLEDLVDRVYVAPYSGEWFTNLVRNTVNQYGLNPEIVERSNLADDAVY